ncbi:Uncharacterised protein [Mycobacteroides abscessus subsp. abscessus]|nr:Uncharacterised protein [Mycobacteroides abscessus subsp. abscessus]
MARASGVSSLTVTTPTSCSRIAATTAPASPAPTRRLACSTVTVVPSAALSGKYIGAMARACNAITTTAVSTPHHCLTTRKNTSPRIANKQVGGKPAVSPIRGDQLDRTQREAMARMATTASSQPNAPTAVRPRTSGTVPYGSL